MVGCSLHVRLASEGIDSTPRYSGIAKQQLNDAACSDILYANRMLRPSQRVEDCSRLVRLTGRGIGFIYFKKEYPATPRLYPKPFEVIP